MLLHDLQVEFPDHIASSTALDVPAVLWFWQLLHGVQAHGEHALQCLHSIVLNLEPDVKTETRLFRRINEVQYRLGLPYQLLAY